MELCLRTPDGAATVVEFSLDAGVSDVTAAFSKLVSHPVRVGSIAAFRGCDGSERLAVTGVSDGDELSVSQLTASNWLACFPSDRHREVARMLRDIIPLSDLDDCTLEHARYLAEAAYPVTAMYGGLYSRRLTELGGPIWILGHETWLSDFVREHVLAQPVGFVPFEGWGAAWGGVYHLPRAILEDSFFRRCEDDRFGDVRASLVAETAVRWGDGHALCKVASLIPDSLSVIAESRAAFADDVWTYREAAMPDARYVHDGGAPVDALPDTITIPESYCVKENPSPWHSTLYLDVRAISVAAKHGVSLEQMWQSLSEHMLICAEGQRFSSPDRETRVREKEHATRQWLAACWRLLALGLHPETRGARGVRGLHLCTRLRSRIGCLVFLVAGADRANVGTIGPCFDAGIKCARRCACHAHHSGVVRLRFLEAGRYPEVRLNSVDTDRHCFCGVCQHSRCVQGTCHCCRYVRSLHSRDDIREVESPDPNGLGSWDEKDSRMERSARMHTLRVRSNRSRATRK